MRDMECLRCDSKMKFLKSEKIQLGQAGWFLGDLPHLISGGMEVDIYVCPACGKIEFFQSEGVGENRSLPQVKCPKCGKMHDFDYPKCPFCKHTYF